MQERYHRVHPIPKYMRDLQVGERPASSSLSTARLLIQRIEDARIAFLRRSLTPLIYNVSSHDFRHIQEHPRLAFPQTKILMKRISRVRFNALAAYCKQPQTILFCEEVGWFEHGNERLLAVLIRDLHDNDYSGLILGRDARGRYRWIGAGGFHRSKRHAEVALRRELERLSVEPDEEFHQGDERSAPLNFFTPMGSTSQFNAGFQELAEDEGYSPARGIISPMMHWYEDLDGNFVEQFQTAGFDARIWELYLFATFVEMGYAIDRIHAVPDFACRGIYGEFCVEAVTVNPTQDKAGNPLPPPTTSTSDEIRAFQREYMPIKYGSALTSKLKKRYWEKPHASNKPLLFAVQDFHAPMSMVYTRSALPIYLYGFDHNWEHNNAGTLIIHPRKIKSHIWGKKEIPSGFFELDGAENISAVLFNNSGTIAKFNRMGVLAGFGSKRVRLVRQGTVYNPDPNASHPLRFRYLVNDPHYTEEWTEGLDVYHNPRAKYPLDLTALPGAVHHRLLADGQIVSEGPAWQPLGSITTISIVGETVP